MPHPFHRRSGIHLLASASLFCLTACADTQAIAEAEPSQIAKPPTLQPATAPLMVEPVIVARSFADWRADFRAE
ncbi:MAG: lytic murein transglycosylase, partial [Halopseudomonas sp.]